MYHGLTYADEAYSSETQGKMNARFFRPIMQKGVIHFPRPDEIPAQDHKFLREMEIKPFGTEWDNFSGLSEFGEVEP